MKRAALSFAAAALFCVAGDAHADANGDVAEKMVRLFERMATLVEANKNDCNAMGDKLKTLIDENSAFLADAKARSAAMSQAERDAIQARYANRLQAATTRMMPGIQACATNPKVLGALKSMQ